jgi:hypothetical protein
MLRFVLLIGVVLLALSGHATAGTWPLASFAFRDDPTLETTFKVAVSAAGTDEQPLHRPRDQRRRACPSPPSATVRLDGAVVSHDTDIVDNGGCPR